MFDVWLDPARRDGESELILAHKCYPHCSAPQRAFAGAMFLRVKFGIKVEALGPADVARLPDHQEVRVFIRAFAQQLSRRAVSGQQSEEDRLRRESFFKGVVFQVLQRMDPSTRLAFGAWPPEVDLCPDCGPLVDALDTKERRQRVIDDALRVHGERPQ